MGYVYANITLKNAGDVIDVMRGYIGEKDIRRINVRAMVDTGALSLIISEDIRKALGLELHGMRPVAMADQTIKTCNATEPVEIHWENRTSIIPAVVLEDATEVLLGAIPLQDMDLIVDPARHQLIGAHGDQILYRV